MKHKLLYRLIALFIVNVLLISAYQTLPRAEAAVYRNGSRGAVVRTIQEKLVRWGDMKGAVDGVYGPVTEKAVRYFQQKNGLTADGVCGPATLKALGIPNTGGSSGGGGGGSSGSGATAGRQDDLYLLSRIISAEARGEPYQGQVAVGGVIMNRIKHPSFPNTLSGVVYQPGAFTCLTDGQYHEPIADSARRAAQDALNGMDPSGGAIYYFNPATATSDWIWSRPVIKTIGKHKFCS